MIFKYIGFSSIHVWYTHLGGRIGQIHVHFLFGNDIISLYQKSNFQMQLVKGEIIYWDFKTLMKIRFYYLREFGEEEKWTLISYVNWLSSCIEKNSVAIFSKLSVWFCNLKKKKKFFGINKPQLPIALLKITLSQESFL